MSRAASPTAAFHDVRIDMTTSHYNIPTPPPIVTNFAPDERSREDLKASSYYTCNAYLPSTVACESSGCLQGTSRVLPTAKPVQTQCETSSRLFAQPSASITHTSLPHSQLNSNSSNYYTNTIGSSSSSSNVGHAVLQSNGQTCLVPPQRCTLTTTTSMSNTASLRNNNITTTTLPRRLPAQQLPLQAQHPPTHTPRVVVVKALQPQYGPPSAPASTSFVPAVSFSSTRQGPPRVALRVLRQTNTETKAEEDVDVSTTNQEEEGTNMKAEEVVNESPLPQSRTETDRSPFAVNGLQVLHLPHYITVPPCCTNISHTEGSSAAQASTQSLDSHSFPATTTGTAAANITSDVSSFSLSHGSVTNRMATMHASHCGTSSASPLSPELTGPTCTGNALAWPYTGTQTHGAASQEGALDKFLDVITTPMPSMCGLSWSNGTDESQLIELSMQSVVIPEVAQRFVRDGARRQHYAQHSTGGYAAH